MSLRGLILSTFVRREAFKTRNACSRIERRPARYFAMGIFALMTPTFLLLAMRAFFGRGTP